MYKLREFVSIYERTVVRGEPLPPPPEKGQRYILVDPTKNKTKR